MKHCIENAICAALCCLAFSGLSRCADAQVPEMTPEQARQALLPYLQTPDTNLDTNDVNMNPVTSVNLDGHTEYLFYSENYHIYRIDAATGEKSIRYGAQSNAYGDLLGTTQPLPASQLRQIALNFVAQHFPGYTPGMFQMDPAPDDPTPTNIVEDDNTYDVKFRCLAPSGADLPLHCIVYVEEDTGRVKDYDETAIPVTVNTTPAISQNQAIQIGQNWIYQNISTDPAAGDLLTEEEYGDVVKFQVIVDPLLNQALVYEIAHRSLVVTIDAHTGAVIGTIEYMGLSPGFRAGPKRPKDRREVLWDVRLRSASGPRLDHAAVQVRRQTYIWQKYLRLVGIQVLVRGKQLTLSKGTNRLSLRIEAVALGTKNAAWERKGRLYVPLAAVRRLSNSLAVESQSREVVLNLPPPRPVATRLR
jgi:hypothetical protein